MARASSQLFTRRSVSVVGGALFGALAAAITASKLEFPFPILPFLKFDLAEIPSASAFLLFGPLAGVLTAVVHWLVLTARAGGFQALVGPAMKFAAVLSTLLGFLLASATYRRLPRWTAKPPLRRETLLNPASSALYLLGLGALASAPLAHPLSAIVAAFGLLAGVLLAVGLSLEAPAEIGELATPSSASVRPTEGSLLLSMFVMGALSRVAIMTVVNYFLYTTIAPILGLPYLAFASTTMKATVGIVPVTEADVLLYTLIFVAIYNLLHVVISLAPTYALVLPLSLKVSQVSANKPWFQRLVSSHGLKRRMGIDA